MKAVHFGAGNIGRGFIGELLYKSGYAITFVDVNKAVIDQLNKDRKYTVRYAGSEETLEVSGISGIDSSSEPGAVTEAIKEADLVTTAVGPSILPHIASSIAEGLKARTEKEPLTIIACENMIGGSSVLKEEITGHAGDAVTEEHHFPDSAVDRIVPVQNNENPLDVMVEPYFEWVVENSGGDLPRVEGITYVKSLEPYIERKLFSVNTGHAAAAYKAKQKGYETIRQAMDDEAIVEHVRRTLSETGEVLISRYGFDRTDHQTYIDTIIERFRNPDLSDLVTRVARGPIRKLGLKDRLVRPARAYQEVVGEAPRYLIDTIIAALYYENTEDEEAEKLRRMREKNGAVQALMEITGLDETDPLVKAVAEKL